MIRPKVSRCALTLAVLIVAACSGGDTPAVVDPPPTVPPPAAQPLPPGLLILTVDGLPGVPASISLSGPGINRTASATTSWSDLPGGIYTITVQPVRTAAGTYASNPSTISATVVSGAPPTTAAVRYEPQPSALALTVSGVPSGVAAPVTVFTPGDSSIRAENSRVITHPRSGAWRFAADTLLSGGFRYAPSPSTAEASALFGDTARLSVNYALSSGAMAVAVSGLPIGVQAQVRVRGPQMFERTLTASETLTDLTPGVYRAVSLPVSRSGVTFTPLPDSLDITVSASLIASPAIIAYAAQVGRVSITTSGLPTGAVPTLTLTGANGSTSLVGATSLDSLPIGQYQLSAVAFTAADVRFAPVVSTQNVVVSTGATTIVDVAFALLPTVVDVPVTGLPDGVNASVTITPPMGSAQFATATTRISPAAVGTWRVIAATVTGGGATYLPSPASAQGSAIAGDTLRLPVRYHISTGSLAILVSGVPDGVAAGITVTGPNNFSQGVSSSTTLSLLTPGTYTIAASPLAHSGSTYSPSPSTQQRVVVASAQPNAASVTYARSAGAITISASGLPQGVVPNFTIAGAAGSQLVSGAQTVTGLNPGAYTVSAATLNSGDNTYTPSPSSANVNVTANSNTPIAFSYVASGGLNYFISHVHVTQATQRLNGSVELVAGRDALLRVFVQATVANAARPSVRVRVYDGATVLQTATILAPEASVRTSVAQGTLLSSWNLAIPASNMRPGLRVLAELDPAGAYPDANAADNVWPAGGAPQAISTRNVPTFTVRFVPVVTGALVGNVTVANTEQYLATTRRIMPINTVAADVRAPFTSSVNDLRANDSNNAWTTLLSEMNALRAVEGAPGQHFYGVVATSYNSGIAGYGYVPGLTAIGWDKMPSASDVAAHEWGHNFSRHHAPCSTGGDAGYPYPGGVIGQIGWNASSNSLVQTNATDIMGYCTNTWISDYTWSAVLQYRGTQPAVSAMNARAVSSPTDGLLIWGRITDGRIALEPAFRVRAAVTNAFVGTHRVELLDTAGATLQTVFFSSERVDHIADRDERHFAVVVPWTAALESRLATVRVRDARSTRESLLRSAVARAAASVEPAARIESVGRRTARITWNNDAYSMAMVRDAANGQILGFVRRSGDAVATNGGRVEVVFSDGVRSVVRE